MKLLPLDLIEENVINFLNFASRHQDKQFFVTSVGCGEAGYKPYQIVPMFF